MSVVRRPNSARTRKAAAQIGSLDVEMTANPRIGRAEADARLGDALGVDAEKAAALRAQVTGGDVSLDAPGHGDGSEDRIAALVDPATLDALLPVERLETIAVRRMLVEALASLPDRERDIIVASQVRDPPVTLEGLGARYGISKERVRQLRERGFARIRAALELRGVTPETSF
jgi:RNA polymerase sigma-32 factor